MIRLYSPGTGELYGGLLNHLNEWAAERRYSVSYEENEWYGNVEETNDFVSKGGVKVFMDKITRDGINHETYQYNTVHRALKDNSGYSCLRQVQESR